MADFTPVFGIDLGTTFSAIAYVNEHGKPEIIPNQEGRLTTPSVVNFSDADSFVVGDQAVQSLLADPDHTVSFIKRRMGEDGFKVSIYGKDYTPQQISALIFEKLKKDGEAFFQQKGQEVPVKDVVITVPAYFGMEQKAATKEAGEIAGLNVLQIVNEPTAAALAFAVNKLGMDRTVFVFDLGGGTFDVTILEIKGEEINMLASDGDPELGGKDWDDVLTKHCSKIFTEKHGEDPQDDPLGYQDLYDRILKGKISLSSKPTTKLAISHAGKRETVEVSREKFEELSRDLLSQCQTLSEQVLKKANKTWQDIDLVLLVGGSTYMPMVKDLVKRVSGKEPSTEVNPDLCVALGAALQAHLIRGQKVVDDIRREKGEAEAKRVEQELLGNLSGIKVTETVAKPIGIIILQDRKEVVQEMIPEQTKIPFQVEEMFGYAFDNQTSVLAEVTEGQGVVREEVNVIGKVLLDNLPPRPEGTPIRVIYHYTKDKILAVDVIDVETGKVQKGTVTLQGSMTEEEKRAAMARHKNLTIG